MQSHLQYTVYNDSARRQQHGNGNFVFAAGAVIPIISDQLKLIKWSTYKGSPFVAENFPFDPHVPFTFQLLKLKLLAKWRWEDLQYFNWHRVQVALGIWAI